jgi:hypothetical protein
MPTKSRIARFFTWGIWPLLMAALALLLLEDESSSDPSEGRVMKRM